MDEKTKIRADELISEYLKADPKYRKARVKACELQATMNAHAAVYWMYIADSLR
ncbi:hypothetical protein [Pseudomonas sp. 3HC3]|uniref:hypothetical protein n=1 Tax=Pseudomonas sp. 3HC3 TaxID=2781025 RepID=UPI003844AD9A